MKLRKGLVLLLCLVLGFSMALTGCQKQESVETETPTTDTEATTTEDTTAEEEENTGPKLDADQTYTYATGSTITSFDPHRTGGVPDWAAAAPIYENLCRYIQTADGSGKIVPGVAESWSSSEDGLVWTFNLRKDAKWSDGTAVTANDFVYSWQRVFDPAVGSDYEWMVDTMIKGGAEFFAGEGAREDVGVTAIDDYTLQIELNYKVGYFLQIASFPTYKPVKQEFVEKFAETYGSDADKVLGNGPFVIESWNQGQGVTYVQNPHYWDKENVHLTRVERKVVKEESSRAQALLNGELDSAGTSEPQWRALLDDTGKFEYLNEAGADVEFFMFNLNNKFLKNKKIRQALSITFDRERYIEEIGEGFGFPAYSVVPPIMHSGEGVYTEICKGENEVIKTLVKENSDAKALLIAGLEEEGLDTDPASVEITLMTRGTGEWIKKQSEWLQQLYSDELGINLKIDMVPWNVMWDNVRNGTYEIAVGGWTADVDDPSNLIEIFHTEKGYYHGGKTGWSGAQADAFNALVDKAAVETDQTEKALIYLEAEKILLDEAVISPQTFGESSSYRGGHVKGLYSNPFTYIDYKGVYIEGRQ